jgi:hypothetical protein
MSASRRFAAVLFLVGYALPTSTSDASSDGTVGGAHRTCCSKPLLTGCPDDYCRKPLPRVACLPCSEPNDYCRKPLPRIGRLPCGVPDDYCRKPWPQLCRPLRPEHYNCGQHAHK